jgi:hypothetical protein
MFPAYEYSEVARCATEKPYNRAATPRISCAAPLESEEELDGGRGKKRETDEVEL